MAKITYVDKQKAINPLSPMGNEKFYAEDANEIKNSVNALYDIVEDLLENITTNYIREITFDTYLALKNHTFTTQSLQINILNDEDKGQENTSYNWTGSVLKWNAEVEDDFQPTIN